MGTPAVIASLYVDGDFDERALQTSVSEIVQRHEILRTAFPDPARPTGSEERAIVDALRRSDVCAGGNLMQQLADCDECVQRAAVTTIDDVGDRAHARVTDDILRPFAYREPPLMRTIVCRVAPARHWIVCVFHHLVADRWSVGVFRRELATGYRRALGERTASPPAPLPMQYSDFAVEQWHRFGATPSADELQYWRSHWHARRDSQITAEVFWPPTSPAGRAGAACRSEWIQLQDETGRGLRLFARRYKATTFMIVMAAVAILSATFARKQRIGVWTYCSNRTSAGLEQLIGWCSNGRLLALDVIGEERVTDLIGRVRTAVFDAHARQDVPIQAIWRWLAGGAGSLDSMDGNFLSFDVTADPPPEPIGGATLSSAPVPLVRHTHRASLSFWVLESRRPDAPASLTLGCCHNVENVGSASVMHVLEQLEALVTAIVDDPEQSLSVLLKPRR
jgi:hypothetical protein